MFNYFLEKKPWKFVVLFMLSGTLFSVILAGIATLIVYQKLSWFIEIVAFIIPVLASLLLTFPAIKFIKSYQLEKENQKSILEIIHNIDDIFFFANGEGKLLFVNQTMIQKLGFSKNELLEKNLLNIHPEIEQEKISQSIGELLKKKQYSCRTYLKKNDGTTLPVETSAKVLQWNNTSVIVCISRDISEQLNIINKLRDSEVRFREFAEMLPELVCEADENGTITFANKNAIIRFGYSKKDMEKGINILGLITPEERERAKQNIEKRIKGQIDSLQEYTAIRKDKTTFPCLVILSQIYENSKLKGYRGLMIDITEQKEKENKLVGTLNFVNNLIENMPLGMIILDTNENCISNNKKALEILEIDNNELLSGKKLHELNESFYELTDLAKLSASKQALITQKIEIEHEFDDENIWLECTALPNTINGTHDIILIIKEITQQVEYEHELRKLNLEMSTQNMSYLAQNREIKQINELLKENQKNLKLKTNELELLINNIKVQIWYLKNPYEYGIVNQAHADFLGKKVEDISYKPIADVLPPDNLGDAITTSLATYKTKTSLFKEAWTLNGNGAKRLLSTTFSPSINDNGEVDFIICSAVDITIERLAEEKIKKNLLHQEYISNISNLFNSLEERHTIINKALALMGNTIKPSRIYVFENLAAPEQLRVHEWLDKDTSPHIINKEEKSLRKYRFFKELMIGKARILSNNTETLNDELKSYYQQRNVKSVIVFPILVNDRFCGVVGIDECRYFRTWEKLEIELLRTLSNLLGNYFTKQEILEKLKQSEHNILEAKKAAEKANALKSEFLANMSHEIRTPMNAILGYAKVLSKSLVDNSQKEYIEIVSESGKNLLALINDILDLSKIEAGKMTVEHKPLSPKKILDEIQNIFRLKAKEKGIDFITEIDPNLPEAIILDEIRLRQVLFNVVGNAIKFTDNGYVKLSVLQTSLDHQNSRINLNFTVEDTGIGINEDQLGEIFKSFQQQKEQAGKYGGSGLGLTITKKLVEMMDGHITVSSKLGEGSQFTIELFEVETSTPIVVEDEKISPLLDFLQAKVLLVEDNQHNQVLVRHFLKANNVLLYVANNGKEALKFLESVIPDIIIMDIKMPVMDGYEATKIIKSNKKWKNIPVISMSAHVLSEEKERMKKVGASGFIPKPIDETDLIKELSKFLKHKTKKNSPEPKDIEDNFDVAQDIKTLSALKRDELLKYFEENLNKLWEDNSRRMQIYRWKDFGIKLHELGNKFNSKALTDYGQAYVDSVNSYNIKKLKSNINLYHKILQTIENFK